MSAQVIGYLGENGVRDVRIPIGHLLDKWQGLRPLLVMVPVGGSDDEAYPVQYTLDGTDLVWHVSDADTAVAGTTKAAVRMVDDGGRVGMDEPFQVIISPNLSAGGEPPVVIKPWVDKLATLVPRAESAVERAENAAQNWESGTAANAEKFGGKPPEAYTAVNLLDNSDWRITKNIINQRKFDGTLAGDNVYFIDRWKTNQQYEKNITIELVTGGLKITLLNGIAGILQRIHAPSNEFTLAAKIDGIIYARCFRVGENGGNDTLPNGCILSLSFADEYADVKIMGSADAIESFTVEWAAIYEGTYTAETLPPFVPRPYAVELAECQRYLCGSKTGFNASGAATADGTQFDILLTLPQPMIDNGKTISIVPDESNPYATLRGASQYDKQIDMSRATILKDHGNIVVIRAPLAEGSATANATGFVYYDHPFWLSKDL